MTPPLTNGGSKDRRVIQLGFTAIELSAHSCRKKNSSVSDQRLY